MSPGSYLRGALGGLLLSLFGAALVTAYLALLGAGFPAILTLWLLLLWLGSAYHWGRYQRLHAYYQELQSLLVGLERPFLLGSVAQEPSLPELQPLWGALVDVSRSVANEVLRAEKRQAEYREHIEDWVHEIKAPLTAARLVTESSASDASRSIMEELDQVEGLVEQVLYYARSENVEHDYFIRETRLEEPVKAVLRRLARQFIASHMAVNLQGLDITVFTDRKWLEFILAQILTNSIKYRQAEAPQITIWAEETPGGVGLMIEDNGLGIPAADIGRVFAKGFTGTTGRKDQRSTGMGLHIAKRLCERLEHGIAIESEEGRFTRVTLTFPKGSLVRPSLSAERRKT